MVDWVFGTALVDTSDFLLATLHIGFLGRRRTGVQRMWCHKSPVKWESTPPRCSQLSFLSDLEASTRLKTSYRVLILSKGCWEKQGDEKEVGVEHVLQLILRSKR